MKSEPIPFLDLITPHAELRDELLDVLRDALSTARFIGGPQVEAFEREFAEFCQTEHCVGVGSGTDALRFALIAAGVGPGQVVVTVPHTFIATCESITQAGAVPEFVDIDPHTYNMDVAKLEEYLRKRCRRDGEDRLISSRSGLEVAAVVPVHLYGQPADMDPILGLAEEFSLKVIEDAAQAHGADYYSRRKRRWMRAGSMGDAAAFSFYPGKNLGACGEGGAVTTNSASLAERVCMLRDHGQAKKYYHEIEGYNGRLDAIQAGFLRVKLRYLPRWNDLRRETAALYDTLLQDAEIVTPFEAENTRSVYHLYVVRSGNRDRLAESLQEQGIGTGFHYPHPLHLQNAYQHFGFSKGSFPAAERASAEILSLPMFPGLTAEQQQRIADVATRISPNAGVAS